METSAPAEYYTEQYKKQHRKQVEKLYVRAKDYDKEYGHITYDVGFWFSLCRKIRAAKVLELGVGTGRIAIPLARKGVQVAGIDISAHMLKRAIENKEKVEKKGNKMLPLFLRFPEDMASFNLEIKDFDLIFIGLNTFFHLLPFDREVCFLGVMEHLKTNGVFGIDVFNIEEKIRKKEFGQKGQEFKKRLVVNKKFGNLHYRRWDRDIYDPETRALYCERETRKWTISSSGIRKDRKSYTKRFKLDVLPHAEIKELLSRYFTIDYELSRLGPSEESHFWICRKQ